MPRASPRTPKLRTLNESSLSALVRLLAQRGLSEPQIEFGLEYAGSAGACTMREGFELAMSRVIYNDDELASGKRYVATD